MCYEIFKTYADCPCEVHQIGYCSKVFSGCSTREPRPLPPPPNHPEPITRNSLVRGLILRFKPTKAPSQEQEESQDVDGESEYAFTEAEIKAWADADHMRRNFWSEEREAIWRCFPKVMPMRDVLRKIERGSCGKCQEGEKREVVSYCYDLPSEESL